MKRLKYVLLFVLMVVLLLSCSKKTTENQDQCAKPIFSPVGGTYTSAQTVTISSTTLGVTIVFTTDGSDPVSSSTIFSSPISINTTTTVKAKAFRTGMIDSNIATASYIIHAPIGFVSVPGGTFTMGRTTGSGDSNELPTHTVTLNSFYISKYEITQSEWQAVMGSNPAHTYGVGDNYPVYNISWYAALKYCNMRSIEEGLTPVYSINGSIDPTNWGEVPIESNNVWNSAICNWYANGYRLPTEAEWEYAARGATNNPDYLYSGSDDVNVVAWYEENSPSGSNPIGTKMSNGLGIFDMSGNIWEWCWDWISSTYYNVSPIYNPTGPASGSYRTQRGGYWSLSSFSCRVADRDPEPPSDSDKHSGLRVCRSY